MIYDTVWVHVVCMLNGYQRRIEYRMHAYVLGFVFGCCITWRRFPSHASDCAPGLFLDIRYLYHLLVYYLTW
jgi:hypothetical protein